jgi:hypothetical protein
MRRIVFGDTGCALSKPLPLDRTSLSLSLCPSLFLSICLPHSMNRRTINAVARATNAIDRLHDALVSLRFLIEVDVWAQVLDQVWRRVAILSLC